MFVLLNLKAYAADAVGIANAAERVSADTDTRIAIAPQTAQIAVIDHLDIEIWAQAVDGISPGSHTGSALADAVAKAGAQGTLLNHSENRMTLAALEQAITSANQAQLETVVCANTPNQIAAVSTLGPDAVAIEPPELIGTGTPVSQADPDIVRNAIDAAATIDSSIEVLCGAGISTGEDVLAAAELGADGVLLASGVALANDPEAALRDLVQPL